MTKPLLIAAGSLLLSACSFVKIEEERRPGPTGELELKALKRAHPEELKGGYSFHVVRDGWDGGTYDSSPDTAIVVQGLAPGRYDIFVSSATRKPEKWKVDVRAGERTTVAVLHRNVMKEERFEAAAVIAGKVLAYAAAAPFYLTYLCLDDWLFGDSDDEQELGCDLPSIGTSQGRSSKNVPAASIHSQSAARTYLKH